MSVLLMCHGETRDTLAPRAFAGSTQVRSLDLPLFEMVRS